jgi:hypothetical protein
MDQILLARRPLAAAVLAGNILSRRFTNQLKTHVSTSITNMKIINVLRMSSLFCLRLVSTLHFPLDDDHVQSCLIELDSNSVVLLYYGAALIGSILLHWLQSPICNVGVFFATNTSAFFSTTTTSILLIFADQRAGVSAF